LYLMSAIAESELIDPAFASLSWNLTGYVLPAFPVLTVSGLSTGARNPLNVCREAHALVNDLSRVRRRDLL
jgi:hypothetical protein